MPSSSGQAPVEPPTRSSPPAGLGGRSARGMLVMLGSWGVSKVLVLVVTLVLARLLTPADFGLAAAGLAVIAFLDAALDLGVGASVVFDQERGITRRVRAAFTLTLCVSSVVAAAGVLTAPLLADLFGVPGAADVFALLFVYPLLRGAGQVSDAVLKRDLRFGRRAVVDVVRAVVRVVVSLGVAFAGATQWAIVVGVVASEAAALLVLTLLVPILPRLRLGRSEVGSLVRFGGTVSAIRVLGSLRSSVDSVIVGSVLGAAVLGYYGIAVRLPELLLANVLWIFSTVAFPVYSRARVDGPDRLRSAVLRSTRLLTLYAGAVTALLVVLADRIVPLAFSAQWSPAVLPMVLICLGWGFAAIGWASGDAFPAIGRPGYLLRLDLPATAVLVGLLAVAAPRGLVAAAAVHAGFNLVYAVVRCVLTVRVLGLSAAQLFRSLLPGAAVALAVAATGTATGWWWNEVSWADVVLCAVACGVVGALTAWCTAHRELSGLLRSVGDQRRSPSRPDPALADVS